MFYKATNPKTGNMWDVWLYYHAGTYYLYSLCTSKGGIGSWDNISVARSADGVHWTELGPALTIHQGATWMGTGSTWGNPVAGTKPAFQINYSIWAGPRQTIFFATSDDLVRWTPTGPQKEFVQDERWYERNGRWDCIWTIARPGGGLYGYWTASPKPETGGQFGFGESPDGLTWTALEPPKVSGVGGGEVGAIEKIGEKYYMLFGTNGRVETLVADRPQGPFTAQPRNKAVLSGHTYFARFFNSPTGLLACHHSIARDGRVFAGLLKGAALDAQGTLRFTWWPGNEALKHKPVTVSPPAGGGSGKKPIRMLARKFDATAGFVLEGKLQLPDPLGAPRGLYAEHGKGAGTAILFRHDGSAELGPVAADGAGFRPEKTVDREMCFGPAANFRLVIQGPLLEAYLDDVLIECYSLPADATGRIGLIPGGKPNAIASLKAWK